MEPLDDPNITRAIVVALSTSNAAKKRMASAATLGWTQFSCDLNAANWKIDCNDANPHDQESLF